MEGTYNMKWSDESEFLGSYSINPIHQCFYSMELIAQAYAEGHISKKIYTIALSRVKQVMNFDWMLEDPVTIKSFDLAGEYWYKIRREYYNTVHGKDDKLGEEEVAEYNQRGQVNDG
ncbi:MAG: hypothetical protein FWH35_00115 [Treponema sp.]|nr:hypothetical protein [Treponema sp.]